MPKVASRSIFLLGMLTLIVVAAPWAWAGTAQGASLDVTKTADTDDGVCDADCSLREAIAVAIAGDTVNVPTGTYTLTMGTELTIGTSLTLNGAGSGDTIIQAATSSADATSRVFNITGGTVAIFGVAIQNGNSGGEGGGIRNSGILTLIESTISGNTAGFGGGIYNPSGTLALTNSSVNGNTADSTEGGIYNSSGTVTLTNSSVSGNTAGHAGGGIYNDSVGNLTLTGSTVSDNFSLGTSSNGGGIYILSGTVTYSTVSGNTAIFGAGLENYAGTLTLINSTVSDNMADSGGGI